MSSNKTDTQSDQSATSQESSNAENSDSPKTSGATTSGTTTTTTSSSSDRGGVSTGHSPHSSLSKPSLKEVLNRNFAAVLAMNAGRQPLPGGGVLGSMSPMVKNPMAAGRRRPQAPPREHAPGGDEDAANGGDSTSPKSPTGANSAQNALAKAMSARKSTESSKSASEPGKSKGTEKEDGFSKLMSDHPLAMYQSRSDETHRVSMLMTGFPADGKAKDAAAPLLDNVSEDAEATSSTGEKSSSKSPKVKEKEKEKDKENRQGDSTNLSKRASTGPVSPKMGPSAASAAQTVRCVVCASYFHFVLANSDDVKDTTQSLGKLPEICEASSKSHKKNHQRDCDSTNLLRRVPDWSCVLKR